MALKDKILQQISPEHWGKEVISISEKIYEYVKSTGSGATYITHGMIRQRVGESFSDDDITLALRALAQLRIPVLEEKYDYQDDRHCFAVSRLEINNSEKRKYFILPDTGEEIVDWTKKIMVYYVPSPSFLKKLDSE